MTSDNISAYLAKYAQVYPGKPAFIVLEDGEDREIRISFSELHAKVLQLATVLYEKGWSRKRAVLLYQEVIDFIIAFLACQHAGVIAVPLSFMTGAKQKSRIELLLHDSGAELMLTTSTQIPAVESFFSSGGDRIELFFTDKVQSDAVFVAPVTEPGSPAFIQYTSGSTSQPKGIMITAGNLLHNQQCLQETFHCTSDSIIFSWLPFYHDMGLIGNLLHAIYVGCTCITMPPLHFIQRPVRWLKAISRYKVTHSGGPNFAYDLCVSRVAAEESNDLDLSGWKVAYNGSEPVRAGTLQKFAERFKKSGFRITSFYVCYGLAEATLLVTGVKPANAFPNIVSINKDSSGGEQVELAQPAAGASINIVGCGKPAPGMEVTILLSSGRTTNEDLQHGEVCISGESVTPGYWNHTADSSLYVEGKKFLRTGDTGFFNRGELFISGRLKEMLIVRGKNIYPYDIEQAVGSSVEGVYNNGVAVFSLAGMDDKLVVVAELARSAVNKASYHDIINRIEEEVVAASGISPFDIALVKPMAIPRTTSGKLQRIKCKEQYSDQSLPVLGLKTSLNHTAGHTRNPLLAEAVLAKKDATAIEEYLVDIIKSKLPGFRQGQTGLNMGLTDIGLDSIKAMELVNLVSRELNMTIDVSRVFQENNVRYLATLIENTLWLRSNQSFGKEIIL